MNKSKLSLLLASLLVISGVATAQTPAKRAESGDGPNPVMQKQDPTATPNPRANVKAEIPRNTTPKESGDGPRADKAAPTMGSKTRAEVKADVGMPKTKVESGDGPTASGNSTKVTESQAKRAQRRAAAKAKREAKMSATSKPAVTSN